MLFLHKKGAKKLSSGGLRGFGGGGGQGSIVAEGRCFFLSFFGPLFFHFWCFLWCYYVAFMLFFQFCCFFAVVLCFFILLINYN